MKYIVRRKKAMLRPVGTNVLVKLPKGEQVSPGGIVLLPNKTDLMFVEVVAVGSGHKDNRAPCQPGDTILIPNFYGDDRVIQMDSEKYVFVDFHNILAVKES